MLKIDLGVAATSHPAGRREDELDLIDGIWRIVSVIGNIRDYLLFREGSNAGRHSNREVRNRACASPAPGKVSLGMRLLWVETVAPSRLPFSAIAPIVQDCFIPRSVVTDHV